MDPEPASTPPDLLPAATIPPAVKQPEDVDTCRICRTEGSPEEPLFHPCKCSGSIGYVHQECLMEWLSHSQKKHCELCKTSFRFTKLYDPNMPDKLPAAVFFQRAAIHILQAALTLCRAALVFSTWFIWLPWTMRFVWWGLFWIADGGFTATSAGLTLDFTFNKSSVVVNGAFGEPVPSLLAPALLKRNETTSARRALGILDALLPWSNGASLDNATFDDTSFDQNLNSTRDVLPDRGTLVSGFPTLRNLTPSPLFNNFVTDVLEGGTIALSVVAAFILVFLIREWVVQQQPQINLAAANNADDQQRQPEELAAPDANQAPNEARATADVDGEDSQARRRRPDSPVPEPASQSESAPPPHQALARQSLTQIDQLLTELLSTQDNLRTFEQAASSSQIEVQESVQRNLVLCLKALETITSSPEARTALSESNILSKIHQAISRLPEASAAQIQMELSAFRSSVLRRMEEDGASRAAALNLNSELSSPSASSMTVNLSRNSRVARPGSDGSWESISGAGSATEEPNTFQTSGQSLQHQDHVVEDSHFRAIASSPTPANMFPHADGTNQMIAAADLQFYHQSDASDGSDSESTRSRGDFSFESKSLLDSFLEWLWDETTLAADSRLALDDEVMAPNDEAAPAAVLDDDAHHDLAQENDHRGPQEHNNVHQDPEVVAAAALAGINANEQDVQDEVEDLEGLMELIGMQGPLAGLFQNAIFTAVVVSATVGSAVWFPYLCGKAVLLLLAYPLYALTLPYRFLETTASFGMDTCVWLGGALLSWFDAVIRLVLGVFARVVPAVGRYSRYDVIGRLSQQHAEQALVRLSSILVSSANSDIGDYVHFSLSSHIALKRLQALAQASLLLISNSFKVASLSIIELHQNPLSCLQMAASSVRTYFTTGHDVFSALPSYLDGIQQHLRTTNWTVSVERGLPASALDQSLAHWSSTDRTIAVLTGYAFFALVGAIYLAKLAPVSHSSQSRKIEDVLIEILQQAGGVLKVILIISIEMLAFPLYCGFLLDVAMLPLFGDASLASRIAFTVNSPWTSIFMHWFIGTCYMFHFALFVSMCRRIMRKGVLYFIRDPDDPTFHPIRDVLERSVTSQLRKIGFSALIYGGLVIVCLGSIVWLLAGGVAGILPIRWMASNNVFGFPTDLLLYTLLKPYAVRYLTPSDGLAVIYELWFRFCARQLRLSNFLFGDVWDDEIIWAEGSQRSDQRTLRDGRFVRAPASDTARIPRGQRVFLDVNEENERLDGQPESNDVRTAHGKWNFEFSKVYVPSMFRLRIAAFIFCLWALTAVVALGLTLVPLLVGRVLLAIMLPSRVLASDIYAFALGLAICSSAVYARQYRQRLRAWSIAQLSSAKTQLSNITSTVPPAIKQAASLLYIYGVLTIVAPALFSLLVQFYLVSPVHAYLYRESPGSHTHLVRLVQQWTLGVQFLRAILQIISWYPDSRLSRALHRVKARGWLHPNVRLATRGFILPVFALGGLGLAGPAAAASLLARVTGLQEMGGMSTVGLAYPAVLAALVLGLAVGETVRALGRWRSRIKDEVYLIGERLHNFGELAPRAVIGR